MAMTLQERLDWLKSIKPERLNAMVPAWAKPTMPPQRFVFQPHQPVHLPAWILKCGKPDLVKAAAARSYPGKYVKDVSEYVRLFEAQNHLIR